MTALLFLIEDHAGHIVLIGIGALLAIGIAYGWDRDGSADV